jgi:small redox-active disulfide protein 2
VNEVVKESAVNAEISKVKDIKKIMTYGVMTTPGLVVDGQVKIAGKMPTEEQIRGWIVK